MSTLFTRVDVLWKCTGDTSPQYTMCIPASIARRQ